MGSAGERRFVSLRKRLDQLGYRQPLGVETLPLVEKLFGDLVHTTESLRNAQLAAGKTEKEARNVDTLVEPYRGENARLVRDNNALHMELIRAREECERIGKDLKGTIRRLEHENADLKFLNNQYVHKVRSLEKEGRAKSDRIATLQEKNMQAVVQTPGGKQRSIPFHRQRMQIDEMVPPSGLSAPPVAQPHDPYVVDIVKLTSTRLEEQEREVQRLKDELERSELGVKTLRKQMEDRDREIDRLGRTLSGGLPHDVVSLEAKNRSNEKLISHLNLQVEYLQQVNCDLQERTSRLSEREHSKECEAAELSVRNEELCRELTDIDALAQQMERERDSTLLSARRELDTAKSENKHLQREVEAYEDKVAKLRSESGEAEAEVVRLRVELESRATESRRLSELLDSAQDEKQRLSNRLNKLTVTERELVLEVERLKRRNGGGCGKERVSPSRLDSFVRTLEEERDHFRAEADRLAALLRAGASSPTRSPTRHRSPSRTSPVKGGTYESRLVQVTRERDELQGMLDKFERHIAEIQGNVKVLTAERDKTNSLYQQSQEELTRLRREAVRSPKSARAGLGAQAVLRRVERERDDAIADLRRMTTERDSLRQRLQIAQETAISERARLEQRLEDVEANALTLEGERSDLRARSAALKDSVAGLEEEVKGQARRLAEREDELARHKSELGSLRLLNEQAEEAVSEVQRRLVAKSAELQSTQDRGARLDDKIAELTRHNANLREEVASLRAAVSDLDREKDGLQEAVDDKTEAIVVLEERLAQKDKSIGDLRVTASELQSTLDRARDSLGGREREVVSLRRQLDSVSVELSETGHGREVAVRENHRLQDDLVTMTRENQTVNHELEDALQQREQLKLKVQDYVAEVARVEALLAGKEHENRELLEQFRRASNQAETWEVKATEAEGQTSNVRLELLSTDTERRHLREHVERLEREIQEHEAAQQAYETQASSLEQTLARREAELRQVQAERGAAQADLASVRELCVKLDSAKETLSRQLTATKVDHERALGELESTRTEVEMTRKQVGSERAAVRSLEALLASGREKEFHSHLSSQERESEIGLLRERLTLADSKAVSQSREVVQLRSKATQLESELELTKRQLTTERFERERAVQELRRHGLATSLGTSSSSPLRSSHSPRGRSPERSVSFRD
ncbi:testis-specific gene 10 protein isoform X1 [Lampetra fluviatilis]